MKKKTTVPALSPAAQRARREYYRQRYKSNPAAAAVRMARYWEKKALLAAQDAKEARADD